MKHISEPSMAAYCEGERPSPADGAHLRACLECRETLEALRALARDLATAPEPPRALRQATLDRLGLGTRRRPLWAVPRWAGFLAGALALAWVLPLPHPWSPEPAARQSLTASSGAPSARAENPVRTTRETSHLARAVRQRRSQETELAETAPKTAAQAALPGTAAQAVALREAAAVGAAAPETPTTMSKGVEEPQAPAPTLSLDSIRNNLIRPGQGRNLSFTITLGGTGPLRVLAVDRHGRVVATLYAGGAGPGDLDFSWDGGSAPSGAYTILIQAGVAAKTFNALVVR